MLLASLTHQKFGGIFRNSKSTPGYARSLASRPRPTCTAHERLRSLQASEQLCGRERRRRHEAASSDATAASAADSVRRLYLLPLLIGAAQRKVYRVFTPLG